MSAIQIILILALATKGTQLVAAIKENNKDQIKINLFFFSLILIIGLSLILFLPK